MSFDIGSILKPAIPAVPGQHHTAVTVHRLDDGDDDKHDTEPETNMGTNTSATQSRIIAALKQHGSLTREKLASITVTGPRKNDVVSLAKQPGSGTTAKPAKAKPLKLAVESCRGVDNPAAGNIIKRSVAINLAPPAPVRAIATADHGAIIIRGTTIVAELDRAECAAVRELFCP